MRALCVPTSTTVNIAIGQLTECVIAQLMIWTLQTKPSHNESPGIHPHIRPRLRIPYRCEVCAHIRRCRCIWKGYEQHVLCRFRILNVDTCVLWRAPDRRWPTILHHPAPQLTSLEILQLLHIRTRPWKTHYGACSMLASSCTTW